MLSRLHTNHESWFVLKAAPLYIQLLTTSVQIRVEKAEGAKEVRRNKKKRWNKMKMKETKRKKKSERRK